MKKILAATAIPLFFALSACGGGDNGGVTSSRPVIRLTYSGAPLVVAWQARAMGVVTDVSSAASLPGVSVGDMQPTITALQDAFKARGADIAVYPGVIDGTTLRQLVMAQGNGVPPTNDEIVNSKTNISEWVLINFEFDDMSGFIDSDEKWGKVRQFQSDLTTYVKREYLKGRVVFAALPIVSCAADRVASSVADNGNTVQTPSPSASKALYDAIGSAARGDHIFGFSTVGGILTTDPAHMGADCNTPDQTVRDAHLAGIADPLVDRYKVALDTINKCKHNPEAIPENGRSAQCWGIPPDKT